MTVEEQQQRSFPAWFTPLTAARRIAELRASAREIEIELADLAAYLEPYGTQTWEDGEYRYRQSITRKTTYTIDETKLKYADPVLYKNSLTTVLDKTAVKEAVKQGVAKHAELFLIEKKGQPYASPIQREEIGHE